MRITVLGAGTFQPTAQRGCPGYLVEIGGNYTILDAGSGSLRQLSRCNIPPGLIDIIFITHLHPDHTGDLVPILFAKKNKKADNQKDIVIYGPSGFTSFYNAINTIYGKWIDSEDYRIIVREFTEGWTDFQDWRVNALLMEHTAFSYGFRLEHNNTILAYSGDTDYCENLIKLCKGADLALIECSFPDNMKMKGHLTPSEAGKAAQLARCKRVLLTHISPGVNVNELVTACSQYYTGTVQIAEELVPITIGE